MIRHRLPRVVYVPITIAAMLVQVLSRLINAALLGGSTYQTTSARAHVEQWRARHAINLLFFWEDDHCKGAWETEIRNACKTLDRAGSLQKPVPSSTSSSSTKET